MGPIALFDKSFIQSLSTDESVWFDQFFLPVVCPVFYVETLADLAKAPRDGRTAEGEVRIERRVFLESRNIFPALELGRVNQAVPRSGLRLRATAAWMRTRSRSVAASRSSRLRRRLAARRTRQKCAFFASDQSSRLCCE